jgi:hypothetical protein
MNSNDTGRIPRTLEGAFGPHTSRALEPMPDRGRVYSSAWWITVYVLTIIALIIIFITR